MGFKHAVRNHQQKISTVITMFNFQLRFNFSTGMLDLPPNHPLNFDEGGLRLGLHSNHSTIITDEVSYLYALRTLKLLAKFKFGGGALQRITSL